MSRPRGSPHCSFWGTQQHWLKLPVNSPPLGTLPVGVWPLLPWVKALVWLPLPLPWVRPELVCSAVGGRPSLVFTSFFGASVESELNLSWAVVLAASAKTRKAFILQSLSNCW